MNSLRRILVLAAAGSALAACGGGGDGKNPNARLNIDIGGDGASSGDTISLSNGDTATINFRNAGSETVTVRPVLVTAQDDRDVRDFDLVFESDYQAPSAPTGSGGDVLQMPWQPVSEDPVFGLVGRPELSALAAWARAASTGEDRLLSAFPLPDAAPVDLVLRPVPLPVGAAFELRVDDELRTGVAGEILAAASMWRGRVVGWPDSDVYLAWSRWGCRGWLRFGDELYHLLAEPDAFGSWRDATLRVVSHRRLQRAGAPLDRAFDCGALPAPIRAEDGPSGGGTGADGGGEGPAADVSGSLCKLAFESDEGFFDLFGDAGAATTYVTQLVAAVGHQYQRRVQTKMELVYLQLYDQQSDPWSTPEGSGDILDFLEEFADAWGANWPGSASTANAAHLLSAEVDQGGIAYTLPGGVLCDKRNAFGISSGIEGRIDFGAFDFQSSILIWDFVVVAHEIGHTFGAKHTHEYCPPFDECSSDFGQCQTQRDCSGKGTLMSYCHTCAGGVFKIRPDFESYLANEMRHAVEGSCLPGLRVQPGETMSFDVTYSPQDAGASAATLKWKHDAGNLPSPFELNFEGS